MKHSTKENSLSASHDGGDLKKYHAEIEKLPIVHVEIVFSDTLKYSGHNSDYYEVPTDLILKNINDRSLWNGCPSLVNWDILTCIEEIIGEGKYAYNSTVGQRFCDKFNLGKYEENSFLSAMVYCTQSYYSVIRDEKNAKEFHDKIYGEGYVRATDELLEQIEKDNSKCLVILMGKDVIFGNDKLIKSEKPLKLKKWGEQGLHWMTARSTRSGFKAYAGQYVKQIN